MPNSAANRRFRCTWRPYQGHVLKAVDEHLSDPNRFPFAYRERVSHPLLNPDNRPR